MKLNLGFGFGFFFIHAIQDFYSFLMIFLLSQGLLGFLKSQFYIILGNIFNTKLD